MTITRTTLVVEKDRTIIIEYNELSYLFFICPNAL